MDSLIAASARALSQGDALAALKHVALREDPPALALRGIAMAQLGEFERSRDLLRRAARGFGRHETLARLRCRVAEAEVALAVRDLQGVPHDLPNVAAALAAGGDRANADLARLIEVRRLLWLGRLSEASAELASLGAAADAFPSPLLATVASLAAADIALRRLQTVPARHALEQAGQWAARAAVPALIVEVAQVRSLLDRPAARRWVPDTVPRPLVLAEVEALLGSDALVVDACRRSVRGGGRASSLERRPVLFSLAQALAEAWPGDAGRDALIERVFRLRRPDETHRARLRVEIGRLRALVAPLAQVQATARGYALVPRDGRGVVLLLPPIDGTEAALQALLADGQAWSTSSLALALGESQRSVQRALTQLQAAGAVRSIGQTRARRWQAPPLADFTTLLLLPAPTPFA